MLKVSSLEETPIPCSKAPCRIDHRNIKSDIIHAFSEIKDTPYLLKYAKKIYNIAIISNLPTIMLVASISFENTSKFTDVIPAVKPVVEIAEAASNIASSKGLVVRELKT